jgi:hypothetical protein
MTDHTALEQALVAYGHELRASLRDHDLSQAVLSALRRAPASGSPVRQHRRRTLRIALLVALIIVVFASTAYAGYRLVFAAGPVTVHRAPPPDLAVGRRLSLGQPVTADDPRIRFAVVVPQVAWLRTAPERWFDQRATGQVSLTFRPQPEIPEIGTTGVGLLIQEFDGEGAETIRKYLTTSTDAERVRIGSSTGVFLTGANHMLFYLDRNGRYVTSPGRLVGRALIFERAGLTIRIEGELTRDQMIELATSLR